MITLPQIQAILNEMKTSITNINTAELVIDDTQLVKFLEKHKTADNNILLGIIPEYPIEGDQDRLKWNNQMMFMVLQKVSDRDTNHDSFLTIMEQTRQCAEQFIQILLAEKSGDNGDFCGTANELTENSIHVFPIWNKSACHGWGINVNLLSNV